MKYIEYQPAEALRKYIAIYWQVQTGPLHQPYRRPVFADACTEIFINLGNSRPSFNGIYPLLPGNIYLGGTMSAHGFVDSVPNSIFAGIRFKPGGFPAFFRQPLSDIVDQIIEFPAPDLQKAVDADDHLPHRLDQYFLKKLDPRKSIIPITENVLLHKARLTVDSLAREHNVSNRTLERLFLQQLGISPKEYIKVIRFQQVLPLLRRHRREEKLLHIAFDAGYYDDAHLVRDVKKYSGFSPSQLSSL